MVPQNTIPYWKRWGQQVKARLLQPLGPKPPLGWEAVLDTIEDWICIIDPGARIIRSNANCRHLFGMPSHDITGTTCCRLVHGRDSPLPGCPLQRMLVSGKRESEELKIREDRWTLITVDPIFTPSREIVGAVHIARDITRRVRIQNERELLVEDLKEAVRKIKTLSGLLPICASCKKIRDDRGYWNLLENYIETHSQASFSHGLCPDCLEEIYGKEDWFKK